MREPFSGFVREREIHPWRTTCQNMRAMKPALFSLSIMSRSGGLIYQIVCSFKGHSRLLCRTWARSQRLNRLLWPSSASMLWVSTEFESRPSSVPFHHGFSNPCRGLPRRTGLSVIESENFRLQCLQTLTGRKIFAVATPNAPEMMPLLHHVYKLYTDFGREYVHLLF